MHAQSPQCSILGVLCICYNVCDVDSTVVTLENWFISAVSKECNEAKHSTRSRTGIAWGLIFFKKEILMWNGFLVSVPFSHFSTTTRSQWTQLDRNLHGWPGLGGGCLTVCQGPQLFQVYGHLGILTERCAHNLTTKCLLKEVGPTTKWLPTEVEPHRDRKPKCRRENR